MAGIEENGVLVYREKAMKRTTDLAVARVFTEGLKAGHLSRLFVDDLVDKLMELAADFEIEADETDNKILRNRAHLAGDIADNIEDELKKIK